MAKYPPTNDFDESGFTTLEPGFYKVKIVATKDADKNGKFYTDKDGYKGCLFEYAVSEHPGVRLFEKFCFDEDYKYYPQSMGKFKQLQVACGIDTSSGGDTGSLVGKVCMADVRAKDVNGKVYNNIVRYEKPADDSTDAADFPKDDDLPF